MSTEPWYNVATLYDRARCRGGGESAIGGRRSENGLPVTAAAAKRPLTRNLVWALDTLADGGLGCALFWPFDLTRYFTGRLFSNGKSRWSCGDGESR